MDRGFWKVLKCWKGITFTLGPEFSKCIAHRTKNQFWKDTLYCCNESRILNKKLENSQPCLYNEIWYNNDVKINNRHIFYRLWYDKGIRYIIDLFDENCIFLTYNSFCEKFMFNPPTRVIQKVLLCTKYYVISNAYPYLVYSNLFRKVSWTKAQFNQLRDLLSKRSRVVYLDACLRHWQVSLPQPFSYH